MIVTENLDKFFPDKLLANRELFQKVRDTLQYFTDEQMVIFKDVVMKYKDPKSLSSEASRAVIDELGFGYITEMIEVLTEEELGTIISYMALIHILKGSRRGLEVIFDLLNFQYEIIEWWEYSKDRKKGTEDDSPLLDVMEWKLVINILESPNFNNIFYTVPRLKVFARNYVYPLLAYIQLVFEGNFDPLSWDFGGFIDTKRNGESEVDFEKIAFLFGVYDTVEEDNNEVDAPSFDAYRRALYNEQGLLLYSQDGAILVAEDDILEDEEGNQLVTENDELIIAQ